MAKPSKNELLILALRARGYSQLGPATEFAESWRFRISPSHARRLDNRASDVKLGLGAQPRLGLGIMPRAMQQTLLLEGEALAAKAEHAARTVTLADLGLE